MSSITVKEALYGFAGVAGGLMLMGSVVTGVCIGAISAISGTLCHPALYTGISLAAGGTFANIFSALVLTDDERDIANEKIMKSVNEFFGREHKDKV